MMNDYVDERMLVANAAAAADDDDNSHRVSFPAKIYNCRCSEGNTLYQNSYPASIGYV